MRTFWPSPREVASAHAALSWLSITTCCGNGLVGEGVLVLSDDRGQVESRSWSGRSRWWCASGAPFSARLREQVDLDTLTAELLAVVNQTMQPTQVSLWLRPSVSAANDQPSAGPSRAAW